MASDPEQPIRVAILDDHAMFAESLAANLTLTEPLIEVVWTGTSAAQFEKDLPQAEVVVLDVNLGAANPEASVVTQAMVEAGYRVLLVTQLQGGHRLYEALRAGAASCVGKQSPTSEVAVAIVAIARGELTMPGPLATAILEHPPPELSERELEVLRLVSMGLKDAAVARRLNISYETCRTYQARIREKFQAHGRAVRSRQDMVVAAIMDDLVPAPELESDDSSEDTP